MDTENQGAARGGEAHAPAGQRARSRTAWHASARWLVHLGLLAFAAAALATLQLLHICDAIHADVGLAFAGLVIVHLAQRRHRIAGMFARLWGSRRRVARELRLLASDGILAFVTINVVVSGILDWNRGFPLALPLLPRPFDRWHLLSSVTLIVYLAVHVPRRRKRLRRSTIR
jgi:hypothetical protein